MSSNGEVTSFTPEETMVLATLKEKKLTSTSPKCTGERIEYLGLEELGEKAGKISEILDILHSKGFLRVTKYENFVTCPKCNHIGIKTSNLCPFCQGKQIHKTRLVEHQLCGYIGDFSEFNGANGVICPKCKIEIGKRAITPGKKSVAKNDGIRTIGSNYVCDTCGGKFEKPIVSHTCPSCDKDFSNKDARYTRQPAYEVVKQFEAPVIQNGLEYAGGAASVSVTVGPKFESPLKSNEEIMRSLEELFTSKGFRFERDVNIVGKSGFEQSFNAVATSEKRRILIDVSKTGIQSDVISLVGKSKDVDAESIILIDTSESPFIATLGRKYNLIILSGKNGEYDSLAKMITSSGEEKHDKRPTLRWPGRRN